MPPQEQKSNKVILSTIWRTLSFSWKKDKKTLIIFALLSIATSVIVYLQFTSFSKIINDIILIQKNNLGFTHTLIIDSIILGLTFLIPAFLNNIKNFYDTKRRTEMNRHHNLWMIDEFSKLDIATFESTEYETRLQHAQLWGIGSLNNVGGYTVSVLGDIAGVITSAIILWYILPPLVLLAVIGSAPIYFVSKKYGLKLFRLYQLGTDETRIANNRRQHFFGNVSLIEVLLFNLTGKLRDEMKAVWAIFDDKVIKASKEKARGDMLSMLFYVTTLFLAIGLVTIKTVHGELLIGSLFLAFTTYRGFSQTVQGLFYNVGQLEEQARYGERWYHLFSLPSEIASETGGQVLKLEEPPVIEFKNVSFKYPASEKNVLSNLNFSIQSGEKFAIVGENGAGKTTLIRLLTRIHDPSEGEILINGINLRSIDINSWRNVLSVLFQDFASYNNTVREAIAMSKPNEPVDDEQVHKVAELTNATDFIDELPKKYEQLLWKGFQDGVELSKGQRQRLAVARVLYRDTLVTVLDEPTASIDAIAEEKIFESIEKKMQGKTVVLISHRFSTVKNADKILVVEHGEVREFGNHKDLMQKNGRYCELYTMQANRYLEEAELVV